LRAFVLDANISLANFGCTYLFQFLLDNAPSFTPSMWDDCDAVLEHLFARHANMMKLIQQGISPLPADEGASEPSPKTEVPEVKEEQDDDDDADGAEEGEDKNKEEEEKDKDKPEEEPKPEEPAKAEEATVVKCCESCKKDSDLLRCPMCNTSFFCSEKCMRDVWNAHRQVCFKKHTRYDAAPLVENIELRTFAVLSRGSTDDNDNSVGNGSLESVGLSDTLVRNRSDVVKLMLNLLEELVKKQYAQFRTIDLMRITDAIAGCITSISAVLSCRKVRQALDKHQLLSPLLRNESDSVAFYLNLLFLMFMDKEMSTYEVQQERREFARPRVVSMCDDIISQRYKDEWNDSTTVTILLLVLNKLQSVADEDYVTFLPHYFPAFASLVVDQHPEIRELVQAHLNRLTPYLSFALPGSH